MSDTRPQPLTRTAQVDLGLRWLDAGDAVAEGARPGDFRDFLARGRDLPASRRLPWARLWPWLAAGNGALACGALLVWPDGSGVHLLLFLLAFWGAPLLMVAWTALAGLALGRAPWWRVLVTRHRDPVIALWCTRQALLAQGGFCLGGLAWLWLMLATRQVIFYWSTSIPAISAAVAGFFDLLGLGLVAPPPVAAAEAGAITGWQGALLADSGPWAGWLSAVVTLWVLVPVALLWALCQWRLGAALARWPDLNPHLGVRYRRLCQAQVHYRALEAEQPPVEAAGAPLARVGQWPAEPGFTWPGLPPGQPAGCLPLGTGDLQADEARVSANARALSHWYLAAATVPTGDLGDLLRLHGERGGDPRLYLLVAETDARRIDHLSHGWRVFLDRQGLAIPVVLVIPGSAS
ncbi:MAG TPA: DUF2868 domain-containing protein [Porticoccaceae bacterium]|nr:DUF2868 domain-containing protein [Porticoccaceae bacterium]